MPEGVNSILVTTVGGGGGYGFLRFYAKDSGATSNLNSTRYLIFPGGAGGEVIVNQLEKTTPRETLQIVAGKAGNNITTASGGEFNESDIINYNGRNGTMISATKARGEAGGYAKFKHYSNHCLYNSNTGKADICYNWYNNNVS